MARSKVNDLFMTSRDHSWLTWCRVNAVAPGCVDTEQFRKECQEDPKFFWKNAEAT
jgi:hypothetical protein